MPRLTQEEYSIRSTKSAHNRRVNIILPWVEELEEMVCQEGEEFDDEGREALINFLIRFYVRIRPLRKGEKKNSQHGV